MEVGIELPPSDWSPEMQDHRVGCGHGTYVATSSDLSFALPSAAAVAVDAGATEPACGGPPVGYELGSDFGRLRMINSPQKEPIVRCTRVAAAACLAILVAACGGTDAPARDGAAPAASPASSDSPASSASSQLTFTGTTLNEERCDGASLADKDAVLWFWTPWCPKCAREAKHVGVAHAASGTQVSIVGIPGFGTSDEMRTFTKNFKVEGVTHVADIDGAIWRRFNVTQQPAYAFIDQSGAVEVVRGEIGPEAFDAKLKELIAK